MWCKSIQGYDEDPLRQGDPICLVCGLYSPTDSQRKIYNRFRTSCDMMDALFGRAHPYGLKQLVFVAWQLFCRKHRLLERMTPMMCVPNLADFLTLADESRLVAIIRHCDFIRVPEMPKVFFGVAYSCLRCHTGTTTNIITSSETVATDMKRG